MNIDLSTVELSLDLGIAPEIELNLDFGLPGPRGPAGPAGSGGGSGNGDVSGPASSVDSEIALFSGIAGKTIKRATESGIAKLSSGVLGTATAGTDYSAGTSALATGIIKSTTITGALSIADAGDFPTLNQNTSGSAASCTGNAATVTTNANLTGEVTSIGNAATVTNSAVIGKVLTGYMSGAGAIAATDTILSAIQKLNGNAAARAEPGTGSILYMYANFN